MSDKHEHECGCGNNHDHHDHHDHDDCDCGCGHDEQTMKLVLDDGSELKCSVIDVFDIDEDRAYIALLPIGEEEVLLYKYVEHDDGGFELLNIESDEEFAEVETAFFEMFEEGTFDEEFELEDGEFDEEEYEYEDEEDEFEEEGE